MDVHYSNPRASRAGAVNEEEPTNKPVLCPVIAQTSTKRRGSVCLPRHSSTLRRYFFVQLFVVPFFLAPSQAATPRDVGQAHAFAPLLVQPSPGKALSG
jgi:hypothetical protein